MKTKNNTAQVIEKIELPTVNRGVKLFIICYRKGGYFANEVGELLEICKVIGGDERYAHRINKSVRYGNKYTRSFKPKPFKTIQDAKDAITVHANTHVQYF